MDKPVVITGLGLVTPLAEGACANFEALLAGRSIRALGRVETPLDGPGDRVSQLAVLAAREALEQAGWAEAATAMVVGTSKGPVDRWLAEHAAHLAAPPATSDNQKGPSGESSPLWHERLAHAPFQYGRGARATMTHGLEMGLHTIADDLARVPPMAEGPRLTVSAACASGLVALIRAVMMLADGSADRVLVVAAESSLHPIFLASFQRLGVLARDGEPVRPLDRNRCGFHISEAAAAVCLERRDAKPGELLIDRFALAGDAHHLTGVDPAGKALKWCLSRIGAGRPVDLVHAHATGTLLNDPIELAAIEQSLAANAADPPAVYSHKAAIGHSLGASGLISVVLNALMHAHGAVPGNVHTTEPLPADGVFIQPQPVERRIRRSLAIAAGFGGATAAVSLISA